MSNKIKIFLIAGARPNFIKIAPLWREIKKNVDVLIPEIIHTGQHYDYLMSDIFFKELEIPHPTFSLSIGSGSHAQQTANLMIKFETLCLENRPNLIIVVGDVNSTLACGLVGAKLNIPVCHIEAGLRSYNKSMPEEINRILTDHLSTLLFCPTENAVKNLRKEGFKNIANNGKLLDNFSTLSSNRAFKKFPLVFNTGDIMYDMVLIGEAVASKNSNILENLKLQPNNYLILTIHRAENTENLTVLEEKLQFVNNYFHDTPIIFPVHPRTKKLLNVVSKKLLTNITIVEPLGYFDMIWLMKNSKLVITDSGGMQKEAYWLKTPCITLRNETEWNETIESGWNILYKNYKSGYKFKKIHSLAYGNGKSAEIIVEIILRTAKCLL